jgi:O-methyltransferase involved in polyketide biosynthesis
MANGAKTGFELGGVPETLLWNLYYRALEARRPNAVLRDPKAVELVDAIDYPLEERFGVGHPRQAHVQAQPDPTGGVSYFPVGRVGI